MKRIYLVIYFCLLALPPAAVCQCPGVFPPISEGYGADGPDLVAVDSVAGRLLTYDKFYLFRPRNAVRPLPLVYFIPGMGMGGNDLVTYERLLRHMSSRGYCVVLLTYRMVSFPYQGMTYRRMYRGISRAARACAGYADTTRLGMVGHSFGASSIPSHLYQALTKQKWGRRGAFMYLMAPHYVFGITQDQLRNFPPHVKLIAEVFQDDDCNDHRMAKDIFETIGVPAAEKDFIVLLSDSNAASRCALHADHSTPTNFNRGKDVTDALDYFGVYRYFDALADYAFNASPAAKEIALGHGASSQRFMGSWPDGTPVRQALISDSAPLVKPRSFYYFHWKHPWNIRRKKYHLSMPDAATAVP